MPIDYNLLLILILIGLFIILLTLSFRKHKIYNDMLLSAVGVVSLILIWSGELNQTFILIPILIISVNGYLILKGGK